MRAVLFATVSLALVTASACRDASRSKAVSAGDAARLLIDRNWIDSWPTGKHDHLEVYRFVPSMGGGVYQDRTVFAGRFELFQFTADGKAIDFTFPHTDQQVRTGYRIERVAGPEPFDLRLTLDHDPRGPGVYYGMTGDHGNQDLEQLVAGTRR